MTKNKMTMTPEMTKVVNKRIVLEHLLRHSPTSRADIARDLQLSKPTVSMIVSELVHEGFARELGAKRYGQGRPSIEIELNARARYAIGVELGVSSARLIITDLLTQPIVETPPIIRAVVDTTTPQRAAMSLSSTIIQAVAELELHLRASGETREKALRLVGIGIGVPAVVNSETMEIIGSNPLNWSGPAPFGTLIREQVQVPVLVTQRVLAAAWAERMFGGGRDVKTLVFARFGSGVATGIVISDQLYTGASYFAGDIANMTFLPHYSATDLVQPVNLQSLVKREAIPDRARQLLLQGIHTSSSALDAAGGDPFKITLDMLCRGALDNDPLSRQVIIEAGQFIGIAIANLIGILNPPLVVLGGPLIRAGHVLLGSVRDQVKRCRNRYDPVPVRIILSELGELAPALGAANLAIKQFLSPMQFPDVRHPMSG
jgi:N-acetylglucosamine repressor